MNNDEASAARPERRDAAENRQRILNAALKLFGQNDVEKVSMNQIAAEAQIGPGTLYRRYRNKSELCLDLIRDNIDILFDDIDEYLKQNKSEPPSMRMRGLLGFFIRFREKKAQLLKGVEDSRPDGRTKSRTKNPLYYELHEQVVSLFNEMNPADGHSVFRADMILLALTSDSYLFQREVRGYTPEMILEQLCSTFICSES